MPQAAIKSETAMSALDAIYQRRSVRHYSSEVIKKETIEALLDAAVHAPTAMHEEPWAFAVIQDKALLKRLSGVTKALVREEAKTYDEVRAKHMLEIVNQPDFNVFYNAGTLIVTYGRFDGPFVAADCWLAAENLMLAARAMGLGSCVIGFAVPGLNTEGSKRELGIPAEYTAYAPIIIGVPSGETSSVPRKKPEVASWK